MSLSYDVMIRTMPTPNPSAFKFIVNCPLKNEGKATFDSKRDGEGIVLIETLFDLPSVLQVHLFENVMTVTFHDGVDTDKANSDVSAVLQTRLPIHNADFKLASEKEVKKRRENLSPEIQKIEDILDRTIRPGLQADGGDLDVISYENHLLTINYQGACGTCPSSMYGTLDAIQSILQNEYDPQLQVTIG
jgi:NFU1 iron-sulfur cluster scaffold homolog, mitochondrial